MNEIKRLTRTANKIRDILIEFRKQRLLETHSQLVKYGQQLREITTESGKLDKSISHNWLKAR